MGQEINQPVSRVLGQLDAPHTQNLKQRETNLRALLFRIWGLEIQIHTQNFGIHNPEVLSMQISTKSGKMFHSKFHLRFKGLYT
jgi:hypothetical protein